MNRTSIEWCRTYAEDGSFEEGFSVNPVRFRPRGSQKLVTMCQRVSPGCTHCYAEGITRRFWPKDADVPFPSYTAAGVASGDFVLDEKTLLSVFKRKKPARVFWGDMTDLFQESVPDEFLDRCFAVCALTPHLTHMFLTKRPERMQKYWLKDPSDRRTRQLNWIHGTPTLEAHYRKLDAQWQAGKAPEFDLGIIAQNVWLGTSVENQEQADKRIPLLLQTPAAVRFISVEPLLEAVDLRSYVGGPWECYQCKCRANVIGQCKGYCFDPSGKSCDATPCPRCGKIHYWGGGSPKGIDWVIVGGESGPGARPVHPDWARSLRDQCKAAGVAFFFKQWGEWLPSMVPFVVADSKFNEAGQSTPPMTFLPDNPREELARTGKTKDIDIREALLGRNGVSMYRVGKKAAGALLDGVEWRQFPEVRA